MAKKKTNIKPETTIHYRDVGTGEYIIKKYADKKSQNCSKGNG